MLVAHSYEKCRFKSLQYVIDFIGHSRSSEVKDGRILWSPQAGALKMREWKMQEWKLQEKTAGVEIAGVEEAGVDRTGGICRNGKSRSR